MELKAKRFQLRVSSEDLKLPREEEEARCPHWPVCGREDNVEMRWQISSSDVTWVIIGHRLTWKSQKCVQTSAAPHLPAYHTPTSDDLSSSAAAIFIFFFCQTVHHESDSVSGVRWSISDLLFQQQHLCPENTLETVFIMLSTEDIHCPNDNYICLILV